MKTFVKKGILMAPGELFLKSEGVKRIFKRKLIQNLTFYLRKQGLIEFVGGATSDKMGGFGFSVFSFRGRIFIESRQAKKVLRTAKKIFGIVWLADCIFLPKATLGQFSEFVRQNYQEWIEKNETFAIRLKREKGIVKQNSEQIIKEIAARIDRKVDLSHPKKEIFVEVRQQGWFLYFKKVKGKGGLPVGSGGKVLCLTSGGIDSPIAAYLVAKRGAENVWLHFHSFPLVSKTSIEKVKELAQVFLNYQPHLKVYFVPFHKAQMEIKTKTLPKYRILLYRRIMLKIAEEIAKKENCQALATGESLGQVSSQTLPNINIIEQKVKIPVLRPLIGMDKQEIINLAKKIKTFQISIKPQEDCCTLFVPKHATARGRMEIIKELEKQLDIKKIVRQAIKEAVIEEY